jgi:leucyl aminopeptidase
MPNPSELQLLSAEDKAYQGPLVANSYLRSIEPDGYLVRLPEKATPSSVRELARMLSHKEAKQIRSAVKLVHKGLNGELIAAFVGGLLMGTYRSNSLRSDATAHPLAAKKASIDAGKVSPRTKALIAKEVTLSEIQRRIMALVDAPANFKRPQHLAKWAEKSGKAYGYKVKVLGKSACEAEGLGALLAVNRGSEDPARFIVMEYKGKGAPKGEGPVAIIGKGITFDTGGLSIKPSTNMHLMKSDMGGAAATFGAMEAAARLQLPVHLVGIVPSTDNSVDALSVKPSDVITSHSGKTIEIIDTDAEGRLVMCDGLSYANKHYKPKTLIDIATLTGSAVRTFGYECAAIMSKDEALVDSFRRAGDACGERVWPLPAWDSYRALDSDVADIKNYSGRPIHGAIDAFKFLEFFTEEHPSFIHFDIAGTAIKQGPYAKDRQATGYGMRLFVEWLSK